jgi:hypothetical protein
MYSLTISATYSQNTVDSNKSKLTVDKNELSTIHIYRPWAFYGIIWTYKIQLNDQKYKMKNKSHYQIQLKPGDYTLTVLDFGKRKLNLKVEAGKNYYVQTYLRKAVFMAIPELAEVTTQFAETELEKLKK